MTDDSDGRDFTRHPTALLIAANRSDADAGQQALAALDARTLATVDLAGASAALSDHPGIDIILIEASGADAEALIALLDLIDLGTASERAIVVTLDTDQIDIVAASLLTARAQLLCAPTVAERVSALAVAMAAAGQGPLRERDKDAERLQRLNEEVARIAETLARLTRGEGTAARAMVGEQSPLYRAAPASVTATAPEIRQVIRLRRLRDQFFGNGLLEDPAWDMLLDLFAADLERAQVSVSSLCIAAAVAPTTALRWIGRMTDEGLLQRQPDPFDRRRAFMVLSTNAREAMARYWSAAKQAGGAIG